MTKAELRKWRPAFILVIGGVMMLAGAIAFGPMNEEREEAHKRAMWKVHQIGIYTCVKYENLAVGGAGIWCERTIR